MKNIFLKSKAKSLQKTGGGDSQKNVHHLGVASEMPPRCLRDASVSIYSCQSDFSSRVWKYAAMLLMVLFVGVGNVWGQTFRYYIAISNEDATAASGAVRVFKTSDDEHFTNVTSQFTLNSEYSTSSAGSVYYTTSKTYVTSSGDGCIMRSPRYTKNKTFTINWTNTNLSFSKITFQGVGTNSGTKNITIKNSSTDAGDVVQFPKSSNLGTYEKTKEFTQANGITLVSANDQPAYAITILHAVDHAEITSTETEMVTSESLQMEAWPLGGTWSIVAGGTGTGSITSAGVLTASANGTIKVKYAKDGYGEDIKTITVSDSRTIHWFAAGNTDAATNEVSNNTSFFSFNTTSTSDQSGNITIGSKTYSLTKRLNAEQTTWSFTVPSNTTGTLNVVAISSGGSDRTLTMQKAGESGTIELGSTTNQKNAWSLITKVDIPAGTYTVSSNGNVRFGMMLMIINKTEPAVVGAYTVTAATSTGDNTLGTVSAGASSLDATETTTITASPATGYRVTNWEVSGTDASISPNGASNSNTTTLTMGTADATVTVTFGPKPYTITLDNQSATTAGTENVTATYNASTNLTSAITCPTKTDKVFAGYFTAANGGGVQLIDAAGNWIASAGGNNTYLDGSKNWKKDADVTLYACWMEYCPGMDIEAYVNENVTSGSPSQDFTILATNKFIYSLTTGSSKTELDNSTDATGQYDGLKIKASGDYVMFLVPANSSLSVKWGFVKSSKPKYSINGGAEQTFSTITINADNSSSPGDIEISSQSYDQLVKIWSTDGNATVLKKITITAPTPVTCTDKYSFHYGPQIGDWETPICFEKVGSTHEWNIADFTIPNHTNGQFYVGYAGSTNGQSATKAWTDDYSSNNGAMQLLPNTGSKVGQAVGAKGTLVIYDDSGAANQYVGFKPNGYGIMYGGSSYAFAATETEHALETEVVTLPDVSTTYTMGLATATEGTYVACAHSAAAEAISNMGVSNVGNGKKKIYLVPGSFDAIDAEEKFAVYDKTAKAFDTDFMTDEDGDGVYEGYVSSDCASIILVRMSSEATTEELASKDWTHKWNQTTGDGIAISGTLAKKYTITSLSGDNCSYTEENVHPATGQKGKFRMWDNSGSQNWYVTFVPYYTLSYDGNGASGSTAATQRSSESSTLTVTVADNGFTVPGGKLFAGWAISQEHADAGTVDYAAGDDYTLTSDATLYAVWETTYAQNIDLATYAQSHSGTAWQGYLTDNGYSYVIGSEDGAEISLDNSNAFDTGLKLKKSTTSNITFNVAAGKLVTIITGNIAGMTYAVNGGAATALNGGSDATHLGYNYLYNAAAQNIVLTESNTTYNILREIKIENPYTVTYNANGGEDVAAATFYGTALTLPSASKGTDSFLGWFTEASGGTKIGEAGGSYTPSASIELFAHWEAVSTDARLASITFSSNAGTLEPAFDPEVVNYTYTMPYGTAAVPTITGATSVNANAQAPEIVSQAAAWNETAVIRGVAQSGDKKAYNVTMKIAPKDGLEIIGAAVTGNTTADVTGLYAGTASVKLSSKKIDSDCYIYVTLKEGQTLQDGDVLVVDVHTKSDIGTKALEICTGESNLNNGILTSVAVDDYSTGENSIVLASVPAGATSIGLKRSANLNAKINGLKVYRAMNPVLTAITIDGRAGELDELVDNKFNVLIPYEADLASLTIEPTIYRNAAHATTPEAVISNEGAWVFGNNTYRVMDKDGDYTDYIIALTRDVLKHTVSFNTHGGSAVASVEVEDGETLDAAPAAPTKEDYIFQYWSESDGGAEIDVTTVQVNDDVEFHAVWAAEPEGIKLFDGEGNLNTTNFISPAKTTITISDVEYPTLVAFGSNRDDLSGAKQADLVMYSATTNATKIKFDLYNNNGSAKTAYLWMVEEGATESGDPIEIEIEGKTRRVTGYYTFDSNKNRSFYLTSSAKADIKVLQVKVIESGSAIPQFGQAGYSVSFNKGRLAAMANATVQFEGASIHSNADYAVLSNTDVKPKTYIQFENAVANTTVKIKRTSSNAYYVTNDLEHKGTSYTTDQDVVLTTTGTWYIGSVNSGSTAALSKIEFIAPKCEEPSFNALANSDICSGDAYVALDGTGTVSDGGSISYKWYEEGDAETVLATTATYMPEADGSYYVVALHHVDGYTDNEVTSDVVTVTTHEGTAITEGLVDLRGAIDDVVTLSVDAEGANLHYTWKECATIDGTYTDVAGAADAASLEVTVTEGMSKYYKVIVHSDCGDDLESIAHVTQFVPVVQQDVTSSIIWDWTKAASVNEIKLTTSSTPKKNEGFVMANGAATVYNNANFESDKLYLEGEYIVRDGKYFQGQMIKFNTTVPGVVRVKFSHTGNATEDKPARELYINGVATGEIRDNATAAWSGYIEVPAGEVSITAYYVDPVAKPGQQYIRVPQIEFYALDKVRDDSWIAPRELGTVCYPNGHIVIGADMYKMAGVNENGKFAFDQVDVTEPGVPYLFEATGYEPIKFYKTTAATAEEAGTSNGMVGTFVQKTLSYLTDENTYYFQGAHFYAVTDRSKDLVVPANRCYVDLNEPHPAAAPKAGVRRIVFGVNGTNSATGFENIDASEKPVKLMIDGKMYILRGEKMYDATGRLVK